MTCLFCRVWRVSCKMTASSRVWVTLLEKSDVSMRFSPFFPDRIESELSYVQGSIIDSKCGTLLESWWCLYDVFGFVFSLIFFFVVFLSSPDWAVLCAWRHHQQLLILCVLHFESHVDVCMSLCDCIVKKYLCDAFRVTVTSAWRVCVLQTVSKASCTVWVASSSAVIKCDTFRVTVT